ncbi:MAG: ABC transporter ATP-binding protein [Bacilli bacterium]|nr:ABC transporter ATP-binding protein [Bacilli bacterium]
MSRVKQLVQSYGSHIAVPWRNDAAAAQRVIFCVYNENEELRLRAKVDEFELATRQAGHSWALFDLTDSFANWLFDPVFRTIFTVANTIAFGYGAYLVFHQQLSPGQLVSFVIYLGMLGWPMFALGDLVNIMSRGNASYDRIDNIMHQTSEIKEPNDPIIIGNKLKTLEFKDVTFAYPGSKFPAIEKINFKVESGKTLGIVGTTGSGKTTILRHILKQYDLQKGQVLINETNIKNIKTDEVRRFFGYVPQEHILFSGSVYKNIAFGKKDATDSEINNAIDLAAFRKDVLFLDDGLDTVVGEAGVTLSGGQRQRLSIARAFVANPEVLILDDSLSAVDGATEKEILQNIKNARTGKTTIIVAHRLSAVEHADEVIVLLDGKMVERGTHEELMKLNGWYYKQYMHQQMLEKTGERANDIFKNLEIHKQI